ncbi:MAG: hypothetical protein COB20_06070 [SAR86 cluster bacterium]|uniref:BAAT/Acyl-CoA thioester hydrolase C-terminal domain-containing protein n=1 Tax=SAR86 cluster bacterium TaxID=2030880 RepID=A0A2A4X8H5_9GAMM|nr:MAG: hypothetical protein COB20_06070 [SAR86 cluster bacterium]
MNIKKTLLILLAVTTIAPSSIIAYSILRIETQPEAWAPKPAPEIADFSLRNFNLEIYPIVARIDQPIVIKVSGLERNEDINLRATTTDASGNEFVSWAAFVSDESGELDVATAVPIRGTYISKDSSGLLWSMESGDQERFQHSESWESRSYEISAETSKGRVTKTIDRTYPWKSVSLIEVSTSLVEAELWVNESTVSDLPIIIRLPGSDGRYSRIKASLLADRGFAVLDLRYHRGEGTGMPSSEHIPIERITDAIDWIVENSAAHNLDSSRIGLYGASKGSELGLLATSRDPRIMALAAWAPASVVFEGSTIQKLNAGSSWTWENEPLQFAGFRNHLVIGVMIVPRLMAGKSASFLPYYIDALERAEVDASISIAGASIPILLLAGDDDRLWPSSRMISELINSTETNGNIEYGIYRNVGHAMNFEIWPRGGSPDGFILGGSREANYLAGRDAWEKIIKFFHENL